ncbi:site-specific DNA-methyltransferase [Candidatus Woesearchaeota archaeon]|nr:site-specific DNA-methyltransferase [Candidatus Woesearchaeota archaeon]
MIELNKIYCDDVLQFCKKLPDNYVDCIMTSPPYWGLRDYGVEGQIGLEKTLEEYLDKLLTITKELKRILKKTGTLWWNHGDCYITTPMGNLGKSGWDRHSRQESQKAMTNKICQVCGKNFKGGVSRQFCSIKCLNTISNEQRTKYRAAQQKCMLLQNYRLILKMIDKQGWILRNTCIWHKPNSMPSSVKDRFSTTYEPVFFLTKSKKYWFDLDSVRIACQEKSIERAKGIYAGNYTKEKMTAIAPKLEYGNPDRFCSPLGRNPGDLFTIPTQPFLEAHFATFPEKLVEPFIKAGCPQEICVKCGKAREPISETTRTETTRNRDDGGQRNYDGMRWISETRNIGYKKCDCNAGFKPGIVFDPFSGAGTTCLVAKKLNRNYLGVDINPDYVKMAERRIEKECGSLF